MILSILLVLASLSRHPPVVDPCELHCSECVPDCIEACEDRCEGDCTASCQRSCSRRCRTCPTFCREHPWITSLRRPADGRRP